MTVCVMDSELIEVYCDLETYREIGEEFKRYVGTFGGTNKNDNGPCYRRFFKKRGASINLAATEIAEYMGQTAVVAGWVGHAAPTPIGEHGDVGIEVLSGLPPELRAAIRKGMRKG
jgi:hypothetical protein